MWISISIHSTSVAIREVNTLLYEESQKEECPFNQSIETDYEDGYLRLFLVKQQKDCSHTSKKLWGFVDDDGQLFSPTKKLCGTVSDLRNPILVLQWINTGIVN